MHTKTWALFGVIFLVSVFGFAGPAFAATTNWTNAAGTGNWQNAGNWDNGLPDATKDVVIASSTNVTVTATGTINFLSLTVGGGSATTQNLILTGSVGTGTDVTIANKGTITQNTTTLQTISGTLLIQNGGTLTHTANGTTAQGQMYIVNFSANTITIDSGGSVNVDDKGYAGGSVNADGNGPGKGLNGTGSYFGGGAANGGNGGSYESGGYRGGTGYCNLSNPVSSGIGSGGGGGYGQPGNPGGGLVALNAVGTLTINGKITASSSRSYQSGGGSGGSVKLVADTIAGTPSLFAIGGGHSSSWGGGGGGGCAFIQYTTSNTIYPTSSYFSMAGGCYNPSYGACVNPYVGGAGQVLIKKVGTNGNLYTINRGSSVGTTTPLAASYTIDNLIVSSSALFSIPPSKTLTTSNDVSITGDSSGTGSVLVRGSLDFSSGSLSSINNYKLYLYSGGSVTNGSVLNINSSGGLYLYQGLLWSNNNFTSINSTGTLYLTTSTLGSVTNLWSAGTTNIFRGFATSTVGTLTINGGTLTMNNYTTSTTALTLANLIINNGTLTHVANGTTAQGQMHTVNVSASGDITINTGGSINVDNKGYTAVYNSNGHGPGRGLVTGSPGGGGANGGNGGNDGYSGGTGGTAYCNISDPAMSGIGSSGAGGNGYTSNWGGGLISLNAAGTFYLAGTISARSTATGNGGGGGGGAVKIVAGTVTTGTSFTFTAAGGASTGGGGGGGGGCVNVTYTNTISFGTGSITVTGGGNGSAGQKQISQKIYGLVGWWTFDGGYVTTSTVSDRSGQNNTGTRYGGITMTSGKIGQAANFNGSNYYIQTNYNNFPNAGDDRTISFWVRGTNLAQADTALVGWGSNSANAASVIELGPGSQTNRKVAFYGNGNNLSSNGTLADNVWNYVTFVLSGTSAKLYINGVLDNSGTLSGLNTTAASYFYIGYFSGLNYFKGNLDEVRVYSRALSASEVAALYNLGNSKMNSSGITTGGTLASSSLVGYWTFDGKDITTTLVKDKSGSANDGTRSSGLKMTAGKIGQAGNFNGSSYCTMSSYAPSTAGSFTIATWVKLRSINYPALVEGQAASYASLMVNSSGKVALSPYGVGIYDVSNSVVPLNKWTFIVATYNADTKYTSAYINGVFDGTRDMSANPITGGINNIGGHTSYFTDGLIDEVRVYNRILSAAEIQQLYKKGGGKIGSSLTSAPKTGIHAGLASWLTFDGMDITGTNIVDKSGSGNNGTINGTISKNIGKVGQGIKFHGLATEYITMADSASINPGTSDYTVSVWINYYGIVDTVHPSFIYNDYGSNTDNLVNITINYPSNKIKATYRDGNGNDILMDGAGITLNDRKWHHLTWIKNNKTGLLYIDGAFVSSTVDNSIGTITTNDAYPPMIGRYLLDANNIGMFNGLLDDLRIYKRALSAKEVQSLYAAGKGIIKK